MYVEQTPAAASNGTAVQGHLDGAPQPIPAKPPTGRGARRDAQRLPTMMRIEHARSAEQEGGMWARSSDSEPQHVGIEARVDQEASALTRLVPDLDQRGMEEQTAAAWKAMLAELDRRLLDLDEQEQQLLLEGQRVLRHLAGMPDAAPFSSQSLLPVRRGIDAATVGQRRRRPWLAGLLVLLPLVLIVVVIAALVVSHPEQKTKSLQPPLPVTTIVRQGRTLSTSSVATAGTGSVSLLATATVGSTGFPEAAVTPLPKLPSTTSGIETAAPGVSLNPSANRPPNPSTAAAAAGPIPQSSLNPLRLAATIHMGQALCDVAVDDSGEHLYVTDDGPEQLLVLQPHFLFPPLEAAGEGSSTATACPLGQPSAVAEVRL